MPGCKYKKFLLCLRIPLSGKKYPTLQKVLWNFLPTSHRDGIKSLLSAWKAYNIWVNSYDKFLRTMVGHLAKAGIKEFLLGPGNSTGGEPIENDGMMEYLLLKFQD